MATETTFVDAEARNRKCSRLGQVGTEDYEMSAYDANLPADIRDFQIDRSAMEILDLDDQDNSLEYWLTKTPIERLEAACFLIRSIFPYDPDASRSSGFFEVIEREPR